MVFGRFQRTSDCNKCAPLVSSLEVDAVFGRFQRTSDCNRVTTSTSVPQGVTVFGRFQRTSDCNNILPDVLGLLGRGCSADFSARAIATTDMPSEPMHPPQGVRPISAHERLQLEKYVFETYDLYGVFGRFQRTSDCN